MRGLRVLAVAALIVSPGRSSALQNNAGANTAEFLKIGAGARALGMGEAFGPVAEGPEAIYWNPAGLAQIKRPQFSYTRSEFLGFFHHDFAAYAHPVRAIKGTLAAAYTRLSQQALPVVTNANIQIGEFSPHSDAFALAYARSFDTGDADSDNRKYFGEAWSLMGSYRPLDRENEPWTGNILAGLSVKLINETIYDQNAAAIAFDGGAIFRPVDLPELSLGFSFRNAGAQERFAREKENLPAEIDFGISYDQRWRKRRLIPALELALPYYGNPYAKLGVEYQKPVGQDATVALRAGFKTLTVVDLDPLSGLAFGIGARYGKFSLDFGFQPLAELGQIYRMTAGTRW